MTDTEMAQDWLRYFERVPKMSTLIAVEKNDGRKILELVLQRLGSVSALDLIAKCRGDDW